jgi:hypothetical protein
MRRESRERGFDSGNLKRTLAFLLGTLVLGGADVARASQYRDGNADDLDSHFGFENSPQVLLDRFQGLEKVFPRNGLLPESHLDKRFQINPNTASDYALRSMIFEDIRAVGDVYSQLAQLDEVERVLGLIDSVDEGDQDSFDRYVELIDQERSGIKLDLMRHAQIQPFALLQDTTSKVREDIGEPFFDSEQKQRDAFRDSFVQEFSDGITPEMRGVMLEGMESDLQFVESLLDGVDPSFSQNPLVRLVDGTNPDLPGVAAEQVLEDFVNQVSQSLGFSTLVRERAGELAEAIHESDLGDSEAFRSLCSQVKDLRLAAEQDRVERTSYVAALMIPGASDVLNFNPSDLDVLEGAMRDYLEAPASEKKPFKLFVLPELSVQTGMSPEDQLEQSLGTTKGYGAKSGSINAKATLISVPNKSYGAYKETTQLLDRASEDRERVRSFLTQLREDIQSSIEIIDQKDL